MDDRTQDLARFLVREHDKAQRDIERTQVFPQMRAAAEGRMDGIDTALAYLAGQHGFREVAQLVRYVRAEMPRPLPIPEGEQRALDGD